MFDKIIILKNEEEFRSYIYLNSKKILKIIIFEDSLESIVCFYCFTNDSLMIVVKEYISKNFIYYKRIYKYLAKNIGFTIHKYPNNPNAIKLIPKLKIKDFIFKR